MKDIDENTLLDICSQYSFTSYYVGKEISRRKIKNARKRMLIPYRESILAFIDTTLFSSGKTGLAITVYGLYWENGKLYEKRRGCLSWREWAEVDIKLIRKSAYGFGADHECLIYSSDAEKVLGLFQYLQRYVADALGIECVEQISPEEQVKQVELSTPQRDENKWMIETGGERFGPYDLDTIEELLRNQQIRPELTFVWKKGMRSWVPLLRSPEVSSLVGKSAVTPSFEMDKTIQTRHSIDQVRKETPDNEKQEKLDINTASIEEIVEVLGIERSGAERIAAYRQVIEGFQSPEQVGELLGLKPHEVIKLSKQTVYKKALPYNSSSRVVDY